MPIRKTQSKTWESVFKKRRRFPTYGEARKYLERLTAACADVDKSPFSKTRWCTIRDKVEDFLIDRTEGAGRLPCSADTAALHRKRLLRFDRVFHSKPLDQITRKEVEDYRNRRRKARHDGRQIKRETVNIELRILFAFAKWAQSKDFAPMNLPLQTAQLLWESGKVPGKNRKPAFILPIQELLHTLRRIEAEREDVGLVLMGMFLFLLRPAAVCRMTRRDVCLPQSGGAGSVRVAGLKKRPDRTLLFPAGSEAEAWVRRCLSLGGKRPGSNTPLVICTTGGSQKNPGQWTTATLDGAVSRLREKLRLPDQFKPYTIRHSTIAWLHKEKDVTLANVQSAADHAHVTTQEFYEHTTATEAESVYRRLDSLLGAHSEIERISNVS